MYIYIYGDFPFVSHWALGCKTAWLAEVNPGWLAGWPGGLLAGWLAGWPAGWLVGWLAGWRGRCAQWCVFGLPSSSKEAVSSTPIGHFPTHEP